MPQHLTDLEQLLLLATLRNPAAAYAASLQEDVEGQADRRVSLGSIHATMSRLEEHGLVRSWKGSPSEERGGKAKRLYAVTDVGREVLEEARAVLKRMWAGVPVRATQ